MNDPLKIGGLVAITLLSATAMGVALLLARDPELLKRLVKQGAMTYHKATALLAETREQLGDVMAEALHQAEQELRNTDIAATEPADATPQRSGAGG